VNLLQIGAILVPFAIFTGAIDISGAKDLFL
jgi:hypothetical protein